MPKIVKIDLSTESINKAIKEIEKYRAKLDDKNSELIHRAIESALPIIEMAINEANDIDASHYTTVRYEDLIGMSSASIHLDGPNVGFIEFGTGIHYNGAAGTSPHPKGQELGFTIGSYGKGLGKNDSWAYYAESGEYLRTHGTRAVMPLYKASVKIQDEIKTIAPDVFGEM